jgi:hypothetical protein
MIKVQPYVPEDYMRINRRHFDSLTFMSFPAPKLVAQNLARGPAFTGVANGEIIACGGILPLWKGVGEAWVVSSELVSLYPMTFAKVIWRKLKSIIEELELERVQTTVDVEHKVSQKWLERMNFENEGLMRKFLGGRDYYRFAWIKGA